MYVNVCMYGWMDGWLYVCMYVVCMLMYLCYSMFVNVCLLMYVC